MRRAVRTRDITHADSADTSTAVAQVLDQLMMLAPEYRWADMDGVAIIRPVAAWTNGSDVLNSRVAAQHVADATVGDTLATILRMPTPHEPRVQPLNFNTPPFPLAFNGGTMVRR